MSLYYTRWYPTHGEWDMDVDRPNGCPECYPEGVFVEVERLRAENTRLREALEGADQDMRVVVCDCGRPYMGTDPHNIIRAALTREPTTGGTDGK